MFEDIDDILRRGKRKPKREDGDEDARPPKFDNNNRGFQGLGDTPTAEEIKDILQKRFGGDVIVGELGGGHLIGVPAGDPKKAKLRQDGFMETLVYLAEQMKLAPTCIDVAGKELAVGDKVKVPGGMVKTVLKVGWKFAILSRTDDQAKDDGVWFENEISNGNFIKV